MPINDDEEGSESQTDEEYYDDEDEYLEYRVYKSDVTNETILEITDFCDDDDVKTTKDVWANQIEQLKVECGG